MGSKLILLGLILLMAAAPVYALDLSDVIFKGENLPGGWVMKQNFIASKSDLPLYEKKFGIQPLLGLSNQVFIVDNRCRLQVNFIQCSDSTQAQKVAAYFFKKVGHANRILKKENIVIEIMTNPDNNKIKEQATKLLSPAKVIK